jgi:hypothetical protein
MRTTVIAASLRPLHWQTAFTTKAYTAQTLSPAVWHHVFVSDTPMTNWRGGSSPLGGASPLGSLHIHPLEDLRCTSFLRRLKGGP